jgi:hypothetical protein
MFSCQVPVAVLTNCDGSNLLVAADVHPLPAPDEPKLAYVLR